MNAEYWAYHLAKALRGLLKGINVHVRHYGVTESVYTVEFKREKEDE